MNTLNYFPMRRHFSARAAFGQKTWMLLATLAASISCGTAVAGPPYVTDDPEPTETGHWEDYAFVSGSHEPGQTGGQAGLDINYGAAEDLQLTVVVPVDYYRGTGSSTGIGNFSLGAKYRFVHQSDDSPLPDISFFPSLGVPSTSTTLETHHLSLFLPLWAQKDLGDWSTFGGGGVDFAPDTAHTKSYLVGWAVTHDVADNLNVGVEVFHQTPINAGDRPETNLDVGIIYRISKNLVLLGSAGPNLEHRNSPRETSFYASLELTY